MTTPDEVTSSAVDKGGGGGGTRKRGSRQGHDRIRAECTAMVRLLRQLERREQALRAQNEVLAREALLCGFEPRLLEPPAPKRRRSSLQPPPRAAAAEPDDKDAAATTPPPPPEEEDTEQATS